MTLKSNVRENGNSLGEMARKLWSNNKKFHSRATYKRAIEKQIQMRVISVNKSIYFIDKNFRFRFSIYEFFEK